MLQHFRFVSSRLVEGGGGGVGGRGGADMLDFTFLAPYISPSSSQTLLTLVN